MKIYIIDNNFFERKFKNLLNKKTKQILYNYSNCSGHKPYYYNLKYNGHNVFISFISNAKSTPKNTK